MSRLTDLLRQARQVDPQLGADLESEIAALTKRRTFGLVFERHQPEAVELPGRTVRRGDKVRVLPPRGSGEGADQRLWRVVKIAPSGIGRLVDLEELDQDDPETKAVSIDDLVVVAEFRDPIYPGLVSTGKVERGGDKPFHAVINAENFHALELLTFTHRSYRRHLHRPAVQHGRQGLEVQQRLRRGRRRLPALQVARVHGATADAREGAAQPGRLGPHRHDRREGVPATGVAAGADVPRCVHPDGFQCYQPERSNSVKRLWSNR